MSILDVNLPDCTGWEICQEIQKKSDSAIIFITANDLEQDILKGNYVVFHLAAAGWGIGR
ncbi:response regulator [Hungatella effluvii]|uniref:response regulator n=1 Tax=Hungatella effluvii TaxID=1096246 RepID=UPI002A817471|nr:response regulator [Hungatella effluvii]